MPQVRATTRHIMKIAIIRQRYVAHGGAENVVARFVAGLIQRGHTVHLIAHRWKTGPADGITLRAPANDDGSDLRRSRVDGETPQTLPANGLIWHPVPILPGGSFLRLVSFALFAWRVVRSEPFDLIFSFERTLCQDIYRAGDGCHREWLHRRTQSRVRRAWMRINPFHFATLWIEKRIYTSPQTRRIIANSHQVKEEIIRHYGTPPSKIVVIHNGVDLNRFQPAHREAYRSLIRTRYNIGEEAFLILFVGSGFERKGLGFLIHAAGLFKARHPEVPFKVLVVGKGNAAPWLNIAADMGMAQEIVFAGVASDVERVYAAADVLALPTLYDPFANVCLEALASGLPVITTRANGASEILTGALSSFILSDAADVEQLVALLLLAYQSDRALLRHRAREISESFSEDRHFDQFMDVCRVVVNPTHPPSPSL